MASHVARHKKRRISLAVGAALAVAGGATLLTLPAGAAPAEGTVHGTDAKGAVQGSYVVLLKQSKGVNASTAGGDLAEKYGGTVRRTYTSAVNGFSASGLSSQEARRLAADDKVEKVVQNQRFRATATQTNPPSWGLDRVDQAATKGDKKYTYPDGGGAGVTAYVLDTGVRISHEDFGGRASYGYDAVDQDNTAQDGNGHGTHVAGTIAGTKHGVAKKAKIVAVRVLDNDSWGTTEQIVGGVDWVTKNHKGPSVANMSLGGEPNVAMDSAVERSVAAGVTYAISAGNDSQDATQASPARVPEALTVAASDVADKQADFSNFGARVDLYGPGVDIVSASNKSDTATTTMSGTSMAAPHVTGAAALYVAAHQDATPQQVSDALVKGATSDTLTDTTAGTPNLLLRVPK